MRSPEQEKAYDYEFESGKSEVLVTHLGEYETFASGHFAPSLDNEALIRLGQSSGYIKDLELSKRIVEDTGITHRHKAEATTGVELDKVVARSSKIGAHLIEKVTKANEWDGFDVFIDTSSFLPVELNEQVLHAANLNPSNFDSSSYRLACAGFTAAFIDALEKYKDQDARIIIASLEPLSYLLQPEMFDSEHIAVPGIFGDNNVAFGFNPSDFELISAQTLVKPDGGVFRINKQYHPPLGREIPMPDHYVIENSPDGTINGADKFHYTEMGAFFDIDPPEGGLGADMNGTATAKFFIRHTPRVVLNTLEDAKDQGTIKGNNIPIIAHQPSYAVNAGIERRLQRSLEIKMPFLLPEMRTANSSSATTPAAWQHLVEKGAVDWRNPFLMVSPGIGSTISAGVIRFKGPQKNR